jgi:hypothetical protein
MGRMEAQEMVGAWAGAGGPQGRDVGGLTQPLRPAEEERVRAFLLGYPGVTAIRELLFTFLDPGRIWFVARVDIDDGLRGAQVKSLVRGIESGLKHAAQEVYRVDVVPVGGARAVSTQVLPKLDRRWSGQAKETPWASGSSVE